MVIDEDSMIELQWEPADDADSALYDMLMQVTDGEPQSMVEGAPGESGFEAWRILMQWYDPCNTNNETDIVNRLISVARCKKPEDIPHAIARWEKEWALYIEKTGEKLPERWRNTLLLRLVPLEYERELNLRYAKGGGTYPALREDIMNWVQQASRGVVPMHMGSLAKGERGGSECPSSQKSISESKA